MDKGQKETCIVNEWKLDYRKPFYEDCTDGDFVAAKQFQKDELLNCDVNGVTYSVRVVASIPFEGAYKTYFDLDYRK